MATGIVRNIKKVDSHCRVALPREWAKQGDEVFFEITKSGNLVIKKVQKEAQNNE